MLEKLCDEILLGLGAGLYHLSLYAALTLPDIAGKLEHPSATTGQRYRDWFDTYALPKFVCFEWDYFSAQVCWELRCSVLHEATAKHQLFVIETNELIFFPPVVGEKGKPLIIDIKKFCETLVNACHEWLEIYENDSDFEKKLHQTSIKRRKWIFDSDQ